MSRHRNIAFFVGASFVLGVISAWQPQAMIP